MAEYNIVQNVMVLFIQIMNLFIFHDGCGIMCIFYNFERIEIGTILEKIQKINI